MNITVIGAGAMGCLFGGRLNSVSQNNVLLVDKWDEHVNKINSDGLHIRSENGVEQIPVHATLSTLSLGPADIVIPFTKSQDTEKALDGARGVFGKDTLVLTLQNGLGNVEKLAKYVPVEQIIVGITTFPSDIVGPGIISTKGGGKTSIMGADGVRRTQMDALAGILDEAGLNCTVADDIYVKIWEKLAFNAALNALCAVTRLPVGGIGRSQQGRKLAMSVVGEVVEVANLKGIKADPERCRKMIEMAFASHKDHHPSMLQDILAKRPTEIEAINAAVVREADQLGIQLPVTETLADLVKVIQMGYDLAEG